MAANARASALAASDLAYAAGVGVGSEADLAARLEDVRLTVYKRTSTIVGGVSAFGPMREIVQIVPHAATCDSLWGMFMQASKLQPLAGSQPLICEWSHYSFRSVLTPPQPYERRRHRTKSLCPTRTHPPP